MGELGSAQPPKNRFLGEANLQMSKLLQDPIREIEELVRRDRCGVSGSWGISHGRGRGSLGMAEAPRAPGSDVPQFFRLQDGRNGLVPVVREKTRSSKKDEDEEDE
ncbi:hypothetical protein CRG98_048361 [Punica granatum]|uniref:Uncharacterized protein n=1 Tax=Punica granatum TaxID=22663 RepID=A0A2I0HIC2_PUNGR|nr:hypothetical protein CRG98_048361 [Punica granatum]